MRCMWSPIFCPGRAQPPLLTVLLFLSQSINLRDRYREWNLQLLHPAGPIYLLPPFQVYTVMIQYLHVLWNDHCSKSSQHSSPVTILVMRISNTYSPSNCQICNTGLLTMRHQTLHPTTFLLYTLEICTFWGPLLISPTSQHPHLWKPLISSLYPRAQFCLFRLHI